MNPGNRLLIVDRDTLAFSDSDWRFTKASGLICISIGLAPWGLVMCSVAGMAYSPSRCEYKRFVYKGVHPSLFKVTEEVEVYDREFDPGAYDEFVVNYLQKNKIMQDSCDFCDGTGYVVEIVSQMGESNVCSYKCNYCNGTGKTINQ